MARPDRCTTAHHRPPRILVIEDELLIALFIEEMLRGGGYMVSAIARTSAMAHQILTKRSFEGALLDLNLDGEYHPELADVLLKMDIPFAFITGYDYLVEPRHATIPVLQKPFTPAQLGALLTDLVGPGVRPRRDHVA